MESDKKGKHPFKLDWDSVFTVECLTNEFLDIIGDAKMSLHVCHETDYFGDHAAHLKYEFGKLEWPGDASDYMGYAVCSAFGWREGGLL